MGAASEIPFNVSLMDLTAQKLSATRPVTALDIFDGTGSNLHEDGLYSILIFGKQGDEMRNKRFSYIDLKVTVFHPLIFRVLLSLKRLYGEILSGKTYVTWNEQLKDFERSDPIKGGTGFAFFVKYWEQIKPEMTKSDQREQNILLIEKYKKQAMTNKILVMPAGLRDIEIDHNGRVQEEDITVLYRSILAVSNTIAESAITSNPEVLNTARYNLQMKFNELYDLVESMVEGKKKMLNGKWASRRVMNGTRNVITAMNTSVAYLGAKGNPGVNTTMVGLYQMMKSALPKTIHSLRTGYLLKVFQNVGAPVNLVNKETLKAEHVTLKPHYFDRWMTDEGLEKVITSFSDEGMRDKPIEIEGRWLGLIYKGKDMTYRFVQDIDEVPESRNKADVHPITFCELLYLSTYRVLSSLPGFVTRYPIAGTGSIYPSFIYLRTTVKSEKRRELNENWEPMDDDHVALEFPIPSAYMNSMSPHGSKLSGLTADFDGDTCSLNVTYSDEAIAEILEYCGSWRAYLDIGGNFKASAGIDTTNYVCHNLTS